MRFLREKSNFFPRIILFLSLLFLFITNSSQLNEIKTVDTIEDIIEKTNLNFSLDEKSSINFEKSHNSNIMLFEHHNYFQKRFDDENKFTDRVLTPEGFISFQNFIPILDANNYYVLNLKKHFFIFHRFDDKFTTIMNIYKTKFFKNQRKHENFEFSEILDKYLSKHFSSLFPILKQPMLKLTFFISKFEFCNSKCQNFYTLEFQNLKQILDRYPKQNFPSRFCNQLLSFLNTFGNFVDKVCCVNSYPNSKFFTIYLPILLFRVNTFASMIGFILIIQNEFFYDSNLPKVIPNFLYPLTFVVNPFSRILEIHYFFTYREFLKQIKPILPQEVILLRKHKKRLELNIVSIIFFSISMPLMVYFTSSNLHFDDIFILFFLFWHLLVQGLIEYFLRKAHLM